MSIFKKRVRYTVLVWNDPDHHVPVAYGSYKTNDEALLVRDHFRRKQRREEKMAQAMPIYRTKKARK